MVSVAVASDWPKHVAALIKRVQFTVTVVSNIILKAPPTNLKKNALTI
jgi:hypothetical protein